MSMSNPDLWPETRPLLPVGRQENVHRMQGEAETEQRPPPSRAMSLRSAVVSSSDDELELFARERERGNEGEENEDPWTNARHINTNPRLRSPAGGRWRVPHASTGPVPFDPFSEIEMAADPKEGYDADSLDYDTIYNSVFQNELRAKTVTEFRRQSYFRWMIVFLIGIATGVVAFAVDSLTELLSQLKLELTNHLEVACGGCFDVPFGLWTGFAVALVAISAIFVAFFEPVAAGSGIPEIKCYLNGVKIPRIVRLNTLIAKVVGTIFGVSAGLPLGKEGPLIHSGAILAAGISQGASQTAGFNTPFFRDFRNDTAKRDFVAGGAAAGIAAAFGGVLFAIEEGASFWDQGLTWRTFLCSMVSTFTVNFLVTGALFNLWGAMSYPGLLNLGAFTHEDSGWTAQQVPLFVLIGIGGGLIGAAFVHLSTLCLSFRRRFIPSSQRTLRVVDTMVVTFVIAAVEFASPYFLTQCVLNNINVNNFTLPQMNCPAGTYNELAALFYTGQENAIRNLYHSPFFFTYASLVIFMVFYFIMMVITFGITIPGGIFIPSILLGASFGRIVGQGFETAIPGSITVNLAALLGSSAVLGGVHRMTLSLTVLMIEACGDMTYAIPIMISLWSAKLVGDLLNHGIYEMQTDIKQLPLLEWEPPLAFRKFHARDVMNYPVHLFNGVESVRNIVITLRQTAHNGFPVVDRNGHFAGLVLRSQLITILKLKLFCPLQDIDSFYDRFPISTQSFLIDYPRYPDIDTIELSPEERGLYVDLAVFFNPVPFTIRRSCPLMRVFRIVRTMGLRHLPVIDSENRPVGMITRHDLVNLEDRTQLNSLPPEFNNLAASSPRSKSRRGIVQTPEYQV